MGWSEDGEFISLLKKQRVPVQLVRSHPKFCAHVGGLAAHTYHRDTTSGGEFSGFARLGSPVPVPESFQALLGIVRQVAISTGAVLEDTHWLRRELQARVHMSMLPFEVGLTAKDGVLQQGHLEIDHLVSHVRCHAGKTFPLRTA